MPDPIRQEIRTDYDGKPVEDAARDVRELGDATEEAAQQADRQASTVREQEQSLQGLVTEEQAYRRTLDAGGKATDESTAAQKKRMQAIADLSAQIRERKTVDQQSREVVDQLTETDAEATAQLRRQRDELRRNANAMRNRDQKVRGLRDRLVRLSREEEIHQRRLAQGVAVSDQEVAASRRRQRQIERLGHALNFEVAAQTRAVDAVRQTNRAHDEGAGKAQGLGLALGGMTSSILASVTGLLGPAGLLLALRQVGQEMDEQIQKTREFAEASLDLQFLSQSFNEQERAFVGKAGVVAGRSPVESAQAFAQLKSRFPDRSDEQLQTLFLEIAETARTTPAGLGVLTDAFAGLYAETGDAQEAQNILRATIIQAGVSDPATISQMLGKFLSPGQEVGGVTASQAAGVTAAATGLDTRRPEEQVTGLRTVMLALMGDLSDEQKAVADDAGIDRTDFITALDTLGQAIEAGRLDTAGLDQLVGSEGITTATALGNPEKRAAFFAKVQAVQDAGGSDRDLTAEALEQQFGADPIQALNFGIKQVEAAEVVAQSQDAEALKLDLARRLNDLALRRGGRSVLRRNIASVITRTAGLVGVDPQTAGDLGVATVGDVDFDPDNTSPVNRELDRARRQFQSVQDTGFLGDSILPPAPGTAPESAPGSVPGSDAAYAAPGSLLPTGTPAPAPGSEDPASSTPTGSPGSPGTPGSPSAVTIDDGGADRIGAAVGRQLAAFTDAVRALAAALPGRAPAIHGPHVLPLPGGLGGTTSGGGGASGGASGGGLPGGGIDPLSFDRGLPIHGDPDY